MSIVARVRSVDELGGRAVVDVPAGRTTVSIAPIVLDGGHVVVGDDLLVHTGLAVAVLPPDDANALRAAIDAALDPGGDRP